MSALYPQDWTSYLDILFAGIRLLGLFLLAPAFSHKSIPAVVKLGIALSLTLALHPILKPHLPALDPTLAGLVVAALRETVVGLLMGFGFYVTFEAVNLAAQFVGYQMGFGAAGLVDPQNQASVSVWVPLHGWLALMVFFYANMHHDVIRLYVASFEVTRHFQAQILENAGVLRALVLFSGKIFALAVQMASPFTLLVLVVNAGLGVLARLLPQMNVLLFSFPLTMLLGFCTLYLIAPDLLDCLTSNLGDMSGDVMNLLRTM